VILEAEATVVDEQAGWKTLGFIPEMLSLDVFVASSVH
jgi:hypothetical protein